MEKIRCRKLRGYKYQLMEDYLIETNFATDDICTRFIHLFWNGELKIMTGYAWDGPSGPTIDTRTFMRGSLVHDALYQLMREGHLPQESRKYADDLLRKICLEDGMNRFRAWYVWKNVRLLGGKTARAREEPRDKIFELP